MLVIIGAGAQHSEHARETLVVGDAADYLGVRIDPPAELYAPRWPPALSPAAVINLR